MADGELGRLERSTLERMAASRARRPVSALRDEPLYARRPRPLAEALAAGRAPRVIAEVKFASPSEGALRPGAGPAAAARAAEGYARAGAAAISVLTEPSRFGGDEAFLRAAREALPDAVLLMKDFFIDPYQFELARACGADAVLLISALLGPRLPEMLAAAGELGLSALVEVHDEAEARAALSAGAQILGVNSRDLRTLKTDLAVARRLAPLARRARIAVAESGIDARADADGLGALGYRAFLIGTAFMRAPDPGAALAGFLA